MLKTISDSRNKEIALGRIKRLASSGLPLEPFVQGVFELINDAVPNSPNRAILVGGKSNDSVIGSTPEATSIAAPHTRFYVESPSEISGVRIRMDVTTLKRLARSKTIWTQDEIALPNFYRSEGFNAVFRPRGYHHFLLLLFQEAGELVGYYPIWRSVDGRAFSPHDVAFIRAAAPHVAHGLKTVQLLDAGTGHSDDFLPRSRWGMGVILTEPNGRIIAMDENARMIMFQLGVLDGVRASSLVEAPIRDAIEYITSTLQLIFHESAGSSWSVVAPVAQVYIHWTGIVLRLRGVQMTGADGREYITILVERGETLVLRQRRFVLKWGLSQREAEILELIAQGKTGPESAILLGISHDTVRKHMSRVFEKLGVENRTAAASIALEAARNPLS